MARYIPLSIFVLSLWFTVPAFLHAGPAGGSTPSSNDGIGGIVRSIMGGAPASESGSSGEGQRAEGPQVVVTETSAGLTGRPPIPEGTYRFVFRVPVKITNAPENSVIKLECTVYKNGRRMERGLPVGFYERQELRVIDIPLDSHGSYTGTSEVLMQLPLDYVQRAALNRYTCRLMGIRRGPDGSSYTHGLGTYEWNFTEPSERRYPLNICSPGQHSFSGNGSVAPAGAQPASYTPAPNTRCVGWTDGTLASNASAPSP